MTTGDRRDCEHAGTCGRGLEDATATVRGKFGRQLGDGFDQVRDAADQYRGADGPVADTGRETALKSRDATDTSARSGARSRANRVSVADTARVSLHPLSGSNRG